MTSVQKSDYSLRKGFRIKLKFIKYLYNLKIVPTLSNILYFGLYKPNYLAGFRKCNYADYHQLINLKAAIKRNYCLKRKALWP